jgi:CubicO group peptidase (beta-lactamase class C family)
MTKEALDALFAPFNRSDAPGLVVGVARGGVPIYRRGFGLASIEHGVSNTPATRLRIGSTSKHFTCLLALLLAEEGKLDIDAPASEFLPELKSMHGIPSLRQFMNHTSGYRCDVDLLLLAAGIAVQPAGRALDIQLRQTAVNFAPGTAQTYCNGGYHLLSHAIERAAGAPLTQVLRDRIFKPVGMSDTELLPTDLRIAPGMATMHVPVPTASGGGWQRGIFMQEDVLGEGGIISTVDDMLRWIVDLRSALEGRPQFGSHAAWQALVTPTTLTGGLVSPYALGLTCDTYRGLKTAHHAGGVFGGLCQMLTVPGHALDIIIMTNGAATNPVELAQKILDIVLAEHLTGPPPKRPTMRRFKHLDGAQYHSPTTGMRFGFGAVGRELGVSLFGAPPAPMWRDEGSSLYMGFSDQVSGHFRWQVSDLAAVADGGAPASLPYTEAGRPDRLVLLAATAPDTTKVGRALVGRYRFQDLAATATVAFEGPQLVMRLRGDYGAQAISLKALSNSAFSGQPLDPMLPLTIGVTARRQGRAVTALEISTGRTRRLRGERLPD